MAAATMDDLAGETMHVKDLIPDPNQIRRHTPRNIGMIGDSLQDVGAARSIVVDEANVILAGNGTIEAASERGLTKVRVIDADGTEIIAVRRRNLTPEQKIKLAMFDNRTSDLAEYDLSALVAITDQYNVDRNLFFTDSEMRALTDREMANSLLSTTQNAAPHEHVPSVPAGYKAVNLVMPEADAEELRTILDQVKADTGLQTSSDALMHVARHYVSCK